MSEIFMKNKNDNMSDFLDTENTATPLPNWLSSVNKDKSSQKTTAQLESQLKLIFKDAEDNTQQGGKRKSKKKKSKKRKSSKAKLSKKRKSSKKKKSKKRKSSKAKRSKKRK